MRSRKRRHNPGIGFLDPISITAIATGLSALVPVVGGLFASKPKPVSTYLLTDTILVQEGCFSVIG